MKKLNLLLTACLLLSLTITSKAEEKYNWAQKIIMPIENTSVYHNETYNFGKYNFAYSTAKKGKINSIIKIEGKKSSILYKAPKHGLFEIFSTYKKLLKKKGFEIVFECEKDSSCGGNFRDALYNLNPFENNPGWTYSSAIVGGRSANYYIAAKKKIAGNDTYVSIFANSGWWNHPMYRVDVAQISALDTKVIPASDIEKTMAAEGRAIFYGINFNSGKSAIKTESEATLAQIAIFLKKAKGQFYVVGHTDDQGSLSSNMTLSQARANSIVDSLVKNHSVPTNKLSPHGTGPLSPVASNLNEDGKALNRRVEIVQKLSAISITTPPAQTATQPKRMVKVPSFKGMRLSQAKRIISRLKLRLAGKNTSKTLSIMGRKINMDDRIIVKTQSPAPASMLKIGGMVTLTYVTGTPPTKPAIVEKPIILEKPAIVEKPKENLVPVPKVTGKLVFSGYKILLKQGFRVKKTGKKLGFIRKQNPAANTRVKKGSTVTITIGR
jgi:OmpA-OmpF porin, OOP family